MDNHLQQISIPGFKPLIKQKVCSAIKNTEGQILCATNYFAEVSGFNTGEDVVGLSYAAADLNMLKKIMQTEDDETLQEIKLYCNKLSKLEQAVISEGATVSYIEMIPFRSIYESSVCTITPIFNLAEQVVGIQTFYSAYGLFGINDYFSQLRHSNKIPQELSENLDNPSNSILTRRELEICYLLANNFSQYQISEILEITRGTISKIISDQICPKFNIRGSNTKSLAYKLKELDYLRFPPKSLLKPMVIILDTYIKDKYFPVIHF